MADRIIKIAENNVEVTPTVTMKDINDVEFDMWGEPESYGQDRIDEDLISAQKELVDADAFDEVQHKKDLKANAQTKIDKLALIQTEMDK